MSNFDANLSGLNAAEQRAALENYAASVRPLFEALMSYLLRQKPAKPIPSMIRFLEAYSADKDYNSLQFEQIAHLQRLIYQNTPQIKSPEKRYHHNPKPHPIAPSVSPLYSSSSATTATTTSSTAVSTSFSTPPPQISDLKSNASPLDTSSSTSSRSKAKKYPVDPIGAILTTDSAPKPVDLKAKTFKLKVKCTGLANVDRYSLSDPIVVVFPVDDKTRRPDMNKRITQTENIMESLNPMFGRPLTFQAQFVSSASPEPINGNEQVWITVYDTDEDDLLEEENHLGQTLCTLGQLYRLSSTPGFSMKLRLQALDGTPQWSDSTKSTRSEIVLSSE